MRVDARGATVQIAELRGQARVELDHRDTVVQGSWKNSMLNSPCVKPTAARNLRATLDGARGRGRGQARRHVPAHEGLAAGVHHRVDDAQHVDLAVVQVAVEVVLRRAQRLFEQHAVRAAAARQALARDTLEGLDQPPDHPQLAPAEARVLVQLALVAHRPCQHRERGLHRLDVARIGQARRHRAAVVRVEFFEGDVGLGADALQHAPRMQLVLAGDDRLGRGAGQAGGFGHQRGAECAELLVVRDHAGPAAIASAPGLARGETGQVEADQARVAGEGKQVEAGAVEAEVRPQVTVGAGVPVVVEEQADAGAASGGCGVTDRHGAGQRLCSGPPRLAFGHVLSKTPGCAGVHGRLGRGRVASLTQRTARWMSFPADTADPALPVRWRAPL